MTDIWIVFVDGNYDGYYFRAAFDNEADAIAERDRYNAKRRTDTAWWLEVRRYTLGTVLDTEGNPEEAATSSDSHAAGQEEQ